MDFDNESLLRCFCSEEEEKAIAEWCKEQDRGRSDIFEYRLEEADKLREEGNELYKSGDVENARARYFAAVWHLDFDIGQQWNMMDNHQLDLNTRKLKVVGNICAAYLKAHDWVNTKKAADVGLRHMEKSGLKDKEAEAKFLYRKGMANLERGFTEDAYEALRKADSVNPGDKQVRQALKTASEGQRRDKAQAKAVWRDKLLTEEEKACHGPWWQPPVLRARFYARLRRCCRRRAKAA
mmetsp:Transcript_25866/g.73582  ORF Transcript_25866/g.73582 Transcript_25866/m.73582 type:complete len:238 (-) Transcript_25866:78-791(-)